MQRILKESRAVVHEGGLEPPRIAAPEPKSTCGTTTNANHRVSPSRNNRWLSFGDAADTSRTPDKRLNKAARS